MGRSQMVMSAVSYRRYGWKSCPWDPFI